MNNADHIKKLTTKPPPTAAVNVATVPKTASPIGVHANSAIAPHAPSDHVAVSTAVVHNHRANVAASHHQAANEAAVSALHAAQVQAALKRTVSQTAKSVAGTAIHAQADTVIQNVNQGIAKAATAYQMKNAAAFAAAKVAI